MRVFRIVTTWLSILLGSFYLSPSVSASESSNIPGLESQAGERSLSNPSYVVGQYWFRRLRGSSRLIEFAPAYDYLKLTLSSLLPYTDLQDKRVEIGLLNSEQSNAFVLPGSHLFLYSDILDMIDSEPMLQALLAHELAHLDLKHYERQTQNSEEEKGKALMLLGAGIAAALSGADFDSTSALWFGGIANQASNNLSYSRSQEQEADRLGRQYLQQANVEDSAMPDLFKAFLKQAQGRPKFEFLSTHPLPENRLADTIATRAPKSLLESSANVDFEYFKSTLIAYRAALSNQPYRTIETKISAPQQKEYATALLAWVLGDNEKALQLVEERSNNNRFEVYLKARILMSSEQAAEALKLVEEKLSLNPEDMPFIALKAQLQTSPMRLNKKNLLQYEQDLINQSELHQAEVERNLALTLAIRAKILFSRGNEKEAMALIRRAMSLADTKDKQKISSIKAELDTISDSQIRSKIAS